MTRAAVPAPRRPLSAVVRDHAARQPQRPAFIEPGRSIDWAAYNALSDRLAIRLLAAGLERGERVAVYLPDGIELHVALLAAEKAGLIALGIGARAGLREVRHLATVASPAALVTFAQHREEDMSALFAALRQEVPVLRHHCVLAEDFPADRSVPTGDRAVLAGRALDVTDVFLLNSTSGTTGMPKCVVHDQARWYAFHDEAVTAAALTHDEVFMSVAPPPFGFGIWTSHVTPIILGVPTVIMPRFDAAEALQLIAQHRVTVLAAVSTQFVMLLNEPTLANTDFTALRVLFTGGEMVPYARALEFENRTGAAVLQFYGSNETGAFSKTALDDPQELRLTTAGRLLENTDVRLFDDGRILTGDRGQPGGKGPLLSRGYYNDPAANDRLYTADGYMLMEDIVTIDAQGYLRVAGRKGDFIIRGGKNISCAAVEEAARGHPLVTLAAAVGVPDEVFGERTMLFVTTRDGASLTLAALVAYLDEQQVSREMFPEYLQVLPELPRSSGDKIAKQVLREQGRNYVAVLQAARADRP